MLRSHTCGELTASQAGQSVTLIGWVQSVRDHGGVRFADLRDRAGLTQLVFHPDYPELHAAAHHLKDESVVQVTGVVKEREPGTINPKMPTGGMEISVRELVVHNTCETLPFPLEEEKSERVNEELRLEYRYLDLRRPRMLRLMQLRNRAGKAARDYLDEQGFLEVETPILFKSTPEGAREFLTPSRLNPGTFYALSQSPQQYKQMLMVAGVERYFSMARCFRDEDLRAERQPEFTQIDMELSFITREDIYRTIEGLLQRIWRDTLGTELATPFLRMTYHDAMNRFGSDKPDMRWSQELADVSSIFATSEFKVFRGVLDGGGVIKAFNAKGLGDITQGEVKALETVAKSLGAKGLAYIVVRGDDPAEWRSPMLKFFTPAELTALREALAIEDGDLVLFAADQWTRACTILGRVRLECAKLLAAEPRHRISIRHDDWRFLWVTDFPLMLWEDDLGRYVAAHHPFTAPVPEDLHKLETDTPNVRSQAYDVVLNGVELGGGSIRIHQRELQDRVFRNVLGLDEAKVQALFGYMLRAFRFGAPPHGGIALGFDRMIALLGNTPSIRDVIAFPKNQRGQDLMASAPGPVTPKQLADVHIASTWTGE